jgi:hypothetical protein
LLVPGRKAPLILAWGDAEAALEMAVQVALVGEARGGGRRGDRLTGLEEATGGTDAVADLQSMG